MPYLLKLKTTGKMAKFIDYNKVIDQAMRGIVKKCLKYVETLNGKLPGNHHFYITFNLTHPGVVISDKLKKMHHDQMTIVIQHQFWDLNVEDKKFSVALSFNNVREKLEVPFDSVISFADPSARFGLQFQNEEDLIVPDDESDELEDEIIKSLLDIEESANSDSKGGKKPKKEKGDGGSKVISIDSFRKK
jgi:hypothetical protein